MDLLDVTPNARCRGVKPFTKPTFQPSQILPRGHLHSRICTDIVAHRLNRAGDKADNVIVVRFRHQAHASTSLDSINAKILQGKFFTPRPYPLR